MSNGQAISDFVYGVKETLTLGAKVEDGRETATTAIQPVVDTNPKTQENSTPFFQPSLTPSSPDTDPSSPNPNTFTANTNNRKIDWEIEWKHCRTARRRSGMFTS
jgi:hypothetical protein